MLLKSSRLVELLLSFIGKRRLFAPRNSLTMIRPDSRQWADLWRSIILPGRLIIITGLLALTTGIPAQDTARNSLTLSLGPALQHRQDLIFFPFIHERSEERRVGKDGTARGSPAPDKRRQ